MIAAALSIQDPRERPAEQAGRGRRGARPVRRPGVGLPRLPQPVALPAGAAAGAVLQRVPPDVQGGVPELPAGARVAGHRTASCARCCARRRYGDRRATATARRGAGRGPAGGDRHPEGAPVAAGRPALARRAQGRRRSASTSARGAPSSRIFPGSALFKKPPRWVMAAELVETSRLWGRVDRAGSSRSGSSRWPQHLVKRSYSEPHWEKKQAAVMAYEKVTLYGVPLVAARKVNYGRIDPALSPGAVHPARPGRGRLADPPPVLRTTTGSCSTRSRSWSTGPGGATSWSTTRRSSTSTTSGSPPTSSPARHFDSLVEEGPPRAAGPAHLHPRAAGQRRPRRGRRGRLPRRVARRAGWRCR